MGTAAPTPFPKAFDMSCRSRRDDGVSRKLGRGLGHRQIPSPNVRSLGVGIGCVKNVI